MVKKLINSIIATIALSIPLTIAISKPIDDMPEREAIYCIAKNIYFEARGEHLAGQIAVGMVVLNRVNDSRFPDTACSVVYQGKITDMEVPTRYKKHICQFSWVCDGVKKKVADQQAWERSFRAAEIVYSMYKSGYDITDGSTHYHATYVKPNWAGAPEMRRIGTVGTHIFYKWKSRNT